MFSKKRLAAVLFAAAITAVGVAASGAELTLTEDSVGGGGIREGNSR